MSFVDRPPAAVLRDCDVNQSRLTTLSDRVVLQGAYFAAEAFYDGRVLLYREEEAGATALYQALRTALLVALRERSVVALHSAAIVIEGRALIFVGTSGAGKSTIAAASPFPLLSDELVVVYDDCTVARSGFWGGVPNREIHEGRFPIAAVLTMEKASEFSLEALEPAEVLRTLAAVTVSLPGKEAWSGALGVLQKLVATVPFHVVRWALPSPDWTALRELVK